MDRRRHLFDGDRRFDPEVVVAVADWFSDREAMYREGGAIGPRVSSPGDDPQDRLPAAVDRKIDVLRAQAGERFPDLELSSFVTIKITNRRRSDTEELIARHGWSGIDAGAVWQMPTILIGSADQIRADLRARRDRFGLSYLVTSDQALPALTEIITGL